MWLLASAAQGRPQTLRRLPQMQQLARAAAFLLSRRLRPLRRLHLQPQLQLRSLELRPRLPLQHGPTEWT